MNDANRVQMKRLPSAVQRGIKKAFLATGCMDLYRGDAPTYLTVIAQVLRENTKRIKQLEAGIECANRALLKGRDA